MKLLQSPLRGDRAELVVEATSVGAVVCDLLTAQRLARAQARRPDTGDRSSLPAHGPVGDPRVGLLTGAEPKHQWIV